MKVSYKKYNLPFIYPFTISKGTKTHQPTLIIQLEFAGCIGYGEAPAISYYNITVDKMAEDIERKKIFLEKFSFSDPERYWHYLHHLFPDNPFLVCALDMAGWDLYGKLKRKSLRHIWGIDALQSPVTDYTIGIDSAEKMVSKMQSKPWPVYKVKVGVEKDVEMVAVLRKYTDAKIRVDANGGWSLKDALDKIPVLKELGVELVEQPLAKEDQEGMKILYEKSNLPLFADESCVSENDVGKCAGYFHGINIKLTKCSGLTPARRMIEKAKALGLKIMLGCMNETTVGASALAQLAPLCDYLDNDGTLLLAENIGRGIRIEKGNLIYADIPGCGVVIE